MPVFAYKAANTSGKTVEGKVEAGGRQDAVRMIEQQGLMPLRVTESSGGTGASKSSSSMSSGKRMKRQFLTMRFDRDTNQKCSTPSAIAPFPRGSIAITWLGRRRRSTRVRCWS